jgi:gamma-glutamylputrescine oxidase
MPQLSIWEKETFFAPQDIIIVGSGFTGLWSALKLAEKNPRQKITVLERGVIPTGASTRNAGFSCFGSPSELLHDVAAAGEEKTFRLVSLRYNGLLQIRKYFTEAEIDYDPSGGFECFAKDG